MSTEDNAATRAPDELRAQLKTWESAFTKANGRKPAKEDIKKDAAIAAKYKQYDAARARPKPVKHTTSRKQTTATPRKTERHALHERSTNAIAATPSKRENAGKTLKPAELLVIPEEEPTPAHIRCALGPTPQKDGAVLGIFDMLSAGTPSKNDAKAIASVPDVLAVGTPSKPTTSSSTIELSKTPQSSGTRRYLDAFGGTPLKRKREDGDGRSPQTAKKLFPTPSFLRRNWTLARIEEDTHDAPTARPPLHKRGFVRSLSSIIQGLKQQQDDRMDDEWDIMNELEAEDRGEPLPRRPSAPPPKILVEDSQAAGVEMPLGPDQGAESSEDEGERDPGALDANGNPRKVWKKKGLKRQTRRVIMRPVLRKAKTAPGGLEIDGGGELSDDAAVEETQLPEAVGRANGRAEDDDFIDDGEDGSEGEGKHDSQQSRHEKGLAARKRTAKKIEAAKEPAEKEKKKPAKKVKPEAHANFRKLKIKNKNSKANGRGGRFGRR